MIRKHFGIPIHPDHVVRMLRQRLRWSSQKPQRRAREQDDKEVERWKAGEFPRIVRESYVCRAHLVFLDESGFPRTPLARLTLTRMGQTPVLECLDDRDSDSVISAITVGPIGAAVVLAFRILWPNTTAKAKHKI